MIHVAHLALELSQVAPVPVAPIARPEEASLVFSGPRFFVALISGIVLAFAFQLVLTNLSVAAGISVLGRATDDDHSHRHESHRHDSRHGSQHDSNPIRKIGLAVGLWTLVTVTIALFLACFFAVKLSLLVSSGLGAIVGLVIWAAYFTLLVWVSSSTVGSLIGSLVNSATSGFQTLVGTVSAAVGARAVNQQVVSTAEAAAAAVRRELGSMADPGQMTDSLEDYLDRVRPAQLDMRRIRRELEQLVNDPELQNLVGGDSPAEVADRLRHIDRRTFVNLVSDRTDLSRQEAKRIVDQLDSIWQETLGRYQRKDPTQDLVNYLKTVQSGQVNMNELNRRIDQLTEEVRRQGQMAQGTQQTQQTQMASMQNQMSSAISSIGQSMGSINQGGKQEHQSLLDRAVQMGMSTLMGTVLGRTDLSDLDVEKILGQLQSASRKIGSSAQDMAQSATQNVKSGFSPVKADLENYLLNSYAWHLNRETLDREFRELLHDPDADPAAVQRELQSITRGDFVRLLTQRGDLPASRVAEIADQLETIRTSVLGSVGHADEAERTRDVRDRLQHYLQSAPKAELMSDQFDEHLSTLLHDADVSHDTLKSRLGQFDREMMMQALSQRQDFTLDEAEQVMARFDASRDRVLSTAQQLQERARSEAEALRIRVESYLRNTHKNELDPEGIKRDFKTLLDDPQAGASALRSRLSQFDRETLVQLLAQRQDLSQEEADRIVHQLEETRDNVLHAPQIVATKAKEQVDNVTQTIADYLRGTNLSELDPDGIQRDLNTLLHDPKTGMYLLRSRLSQVDRETLVKLLSQRQDMSEEQVNRTIDNVQRAIRQIARSPRRMASRTQQRVMSFESALESYLRNTHKDELNPEGIKRDLQLLLRDPRAGLGQLGDRVAHIDRETLIALLSQRQDMTEAEAARVVDQVLSVRDQFMSQIHAIQHRIESVIDGMFARIRNYLNGLERPELNYEGIRMDLRTLFHDPQAGFEALRDRLSHFNRETVVALLASREDISEADANRIIDQVEHARSNVLRRAERIQQDAQHRVEEVKRQAKRQAEETRKAAASASWWLFGTAVISALASAAAGALAVAGGL